MLQPYTIHIFINLTTSGGCGGPLAFLAICCGFNFGPFWENLRLTDVIILLWNRHHFQKKHISPRGHQRAPPPGQLGPFGSPTKKKETPKENFLTFMNTSAHFHLLFSSQRITVMLTLPTATIGYERAKSGASPPEKFSENFVYFHKGNCLILSSLNFFCQILLLSCPSRRPSKPINQSF